MDSVTKVTLARVTVDESHQQAWTIRSDVAGRMNPVNPADAGYTQAADVLRHAGMDVHAHAEGAITDEVLADCDVLIIPHCSTPEWETTTGAGSPVFDVAEIDAIERYVRAGGGLVILAETEQAKYGNSLAEIAGRFGVELHSSTVQDPVCPIQRRSHLGSGGTSTERRVGLVGGGATGWAVSRWNPQSRRS